MRKSELIIFVPYMFYFVKGDYILEKRQTAEQNKNDRPVLEITEEMIEAGVAYLRDSG
jgi:predicted peroxiredoxin